MRIAFGNKSRVGKDTSALFAKDILGEDTQILSFARPLHNICENIQRELNKPIQKDRKLLQTIGMALRDCYGADVMCDFLISKVGTGNVIVTDLRFNNEYAALRKNGFITIRILRDVSDIGGNREHVSETELDNAEFDYVINNNGTLDDLRNKVRAIIHAQKKCM